jgi:3',5'-cyclic AMP phosphodiesterase CpdA
MRTIAHISDLHFGAVDAGVVEALRDALLVLAPDLVAVSGDLTQRARDAQFRAARKFLDALPFPRVVVPGNHDVPLYDVLSRFGNPLGNFRRHISGERFPAYQDDEIAACGADTTRSFTIKDGGLRTTDVRRLGAWLDGLSPRVVRIVVCHHPLDAPSTTAQRLTYPRPDIAAMTTLIERGADVFLTGHLHLSSTGHSAVRYPAHRRTAILVGAGTATSHRSRGEGNAFNLLRVTAEEVSVDRMTWDSVRREFSSTHVELFSRTDAGWTSAEVIPTAAPVP